MVGRRIASASLVYGLLGCAALFWSALGDRTPFEHPEPWIELSASWRLAISLLGGVLLAVVVLASTRVLVRRTQWAQDLHEGFYTILGPMQSKEILFFALASGIAEELFFRGAMQPALGLVASALIFGAVHVGPSTRFVPWTLWAGAMGLVFGALFAATGQILGPIVAHVLINYENMHLICAYDPRGARQRTISDPALVGVRLRNGGKVGP